MQRGKKRTVVAEPTNGDRGFLSASRLADDRAWPKVSDSVSDMRYARSMSKDKGGGEARVGHLTLLTDLSTGSWGRCVRHKDSSLQTDCRRFSSTRPCRRTLTAFPRRRRRLHEGPAAYAVMLEMNNSSCVRSFVPIDEQPQSSLLPQSVMQSGTARGPSAEQ